MLLLVRRESSVSLPLSSPTACSSVTLTRQRSPKTKPEQPGSIVCHIFASTTAVWQSGARRDEKPEREDAGGYVAVPAEFVADRRKQQRKGVAGIDPTAIVTNVIATSSIQSNRTRVTWTPTPKDMNASRGASAALHSVWGRSNTPTVHFGNTTPSNVTPEFA